MSKASNSVGRIGSAWGWGWENLQFLRMRLAGLRSKEGELASLVAEIDAYRGLYEGQSERRFDDARIFEVGYGARPLRLIASISLGLDARGIDLDAPMLERSGAELLRILRRNGPLRFVKSSVRALVFDAHERRALIRVLARRGARLRLAPDRFLVGDIATAAIAPGSVDFFYSEDVFEHIPGAALDAVCAGMARALAPGGMAVISPSVYTGICGGHLVEWYPNSFARDGVRRSEPWEHLRRRRFVADCFLNEWRVRDYRALFEAHFDIVSVDNLKPGLGRQFLTPALRTELAAYDEDELLSEKWRFVLRKKA
ncbi:Methyltransf_11 domain-containing protein [Rubrivivax sp. A210]|uniref:class I SAM-dependent methyltransferase n=1 Tax=Rubrivivax sp. A210 TaxID=2772301 RepID=UPI00191B565E|nr:class I SAM-dependent methyltransferase [Rubrivivax sp. A210]CAD5369178.1 Methyltransf_11 domain-containing protein [Rubrivivax sp. A210]